MAPRANWKGYLKLSLVSCGVALFPATTRSSRIRFNVINRETGNRVKNQVVDAETGEEVPDEDRVKGYKLDNDSYVQVEDEDFDKVALESTHTIDIESFVDRSEVDPLYLDESFFLVPNDKVGVEAFAVIREAMKDKGMVGLARVVLYRREQVLMLEPRGKGIVATAIRFANEVRDPEEYFEDVPDVKVSDDMLKLAEHILDTKKAEFDPSKFEDHYETALAELIAAKQAGRKPQAAPAAQPSNVINLMDALRRSVNAEKGGRSGDAGSNDNTRGKAKMASKTSVSKTARKPPAKAAAKSAAKRAPKPAAKRKRAS
ncbi:MAG: Ku protein [Xanthobacteraceae bacterium]|nr:Ku protein [Xanthobacteraceae bacterium]